VLGTPRPPSSCFRPQRNWLNCTVSSNTTAVSRCPDLPQHSSSMGAAWMADPRCPDVPQGSSRRVAISRSTWTAVGEGQGSSALHPCSSSPLVSSRPRPDLYMPHASAVVSSDQQSSLSHPSAIHCASTMPHADPASAVTTPRPSAIHRTSTVPHTDPATAVTVPRTSAVPCTATASSTGQQEMMVAMPLPPPCLHCAPSLHWATVTATGEKQKEQGCYCNSSWSPTEGGRTSSHQPSPDP